ncbi:MAG: carboxypeptidase Taq [Candidatus Azotimanducaceae bacterium]|jgi:carboxypeptidase Taq
MNAYETLAARNKRLSALKNALGILHWDQETMMPPAAAPSRAEVFAELGVMAHEISTLDDTSDLLADADQQDDLDVWQRANLREIRHAYLHANAVPAELVKHIEIARSESTMVWREARPKNDFAALAPKLDKLFGLIREQATVKSEAMNVTPYESLLDEYDPGRREAQVDAIFTDLESFLPGFLQKVMEKQAAAPAAVMPPGPFAQADQENLSREVLKILDFPFERGRLDTAAHPFSGGADGDRRITTRYEDDDFTKSLMAVIHETGHALYQDGLPKQWQGQPVGNHRGMTVHESQSLLLEMQAARSEQFIRFLSSVLKTQMRGTGSAWEPNNILRLYRKVEPGLIRVYADEVTYPLHVILRYKMEKSILAGDITTSDLPHAWNESMKNTLGIEPPNDTDGVMQDVHWPAGIFGYFPTYSLGAMAAAQIFKTATNANTEIAPALGRGEFKPLYNWLSDNIRSQGCLLMPDELIEQATGAPLGTEAYKASITERYLA